MTDRTPEQIAEEAERILNSEVFLEAVATVRGRAIADILAADGEDADRVRRDRAHLANAVDAVVVEIKLAMAHAKVALRPRGGVA